ncbi:MAG TPA: hypothetical protein VMN36_01990 [Verrucomicrobiales bacterium]|nr:hypothetical protein [Verrucomicrobiales bacterium]
MMTYPPSGALSVRVRESGCFILNMRTRFPFRFGIVSMTALPHLFLRLRCTAGDRTVEGIASEGLAPKWFTKDPATSILDDLPEMVGVITHAATLALAAGEGAPKSFFQLWRDLYDAQAAWAREKSIAPLLANLGVSLVERAVVDALCRSLNRPFAALLRENTFGIDLAAVRPGLEGLQIREILPETPLRSIIARHTVGLGDALTEADLAPGEAVRDGLPQTLEEVLSAYEITHLKIKLFGDVDRDTDRLRQIAALLQRKAPAGYAFTLDGNENFRSIDHFLNDWNVYLEDPALRAFLGHLLFVEQPLHRDAALGAEAGLALAAWKDRPPVIIDESDADLSNLPQALALGYAGTSHKNCKGIVKGIANAALLRRRSVLHPESAALLSGEDLSNVGPVALLQDLALLATLGIPHAERNGHHYFRGLTMFPQDVQDRTLEAHSDLYHHHEAGFATVRVAHGKVSAASAVEAPFGTGFLLDPSRFTPLDQWKPESVGG